MIERLDLVLRQGQRRIRSRQCGNQVVSDIEGDRARPLGRVGINQDDNGELVRRHHDDLARKTGKSSILRYNLREVVDSVGRFDRPGEPRLPIAERAIGEVGLCASQA